MPARCWSSILVHEERHFGQRLRGDVLVELVELDDVRPLRAVLADRFDAVEHRPDFGEQRIVRAVEPPVDAGGEHVGNRRDVEAREDLLLRAGRLILNVILRGRDVVTAPVREGIGIADRPARLRREDVEVAGEARSDHLRVEVIGEREVLGVLPVIRNVGFLVLGIRERVVGVRRRAAGEVPAVHLAVVVVDEPGAVRVAQVVIHRVGRVGDGELGAVALRVRRRAFGAGEAAEVVVEGVVLLHDDDDVLDRVGRVGRTGLGGRRASRWSSASARSAPAWCRRPGRCSPACRRSCRRRAARRRRRGRRRPRSSAVTPWVRAS